jgi:putative acetyltransferase
MNAITIRKIEPKDNAAIAALIRAVLVEHDAPKVGTAYADTSLDRLSDVYADERSEYFVVEKEGVIIGGAGVAPLENGADTVSELQKMYFLPEARGLGLGANLMQQCLDTAKSFGFSQCYLETLPNMKAAQKLYTKFGFAYLDKPLGNTGHSSCPVWMIKNLV